MSTIAPVLAAAGLPIASPLASVASALRKVRSASATISSLEQVFAFETGPMPTGVTVSHDGRIFVNFPRWGDDVPYTVGEIATARSWPIPMPPSTRPTSKPGTSLLSVQSVVVDPANRLWILDTAAPEFAAPIAGCAKLVAVDLATNKVVKTIVFPAGVILPSTYVNDVRFDLSAARRASPTSPTPR